MQRDFVFRGIRGRERSRKNWNKSRIRIHFVQTICVYLVWMVGNPYFYFNRLVYPFSTPSSFLDLFFLDFFLNLCYHNLLHIWNKFQLMNNPCFYFELWALPKYPITDLRITSRENSENHPIRMNFATSIPACQIRSLSFVLTRVLHFSQNYFLFPPTRPKLLLAHTFNNIACLVCSSFSLFVCFRILRSCVDGMAPETVSIIL